MSIASSPDCLFRPEDKTLQMLFPSVEDGNTFDEFLNEELYGPNQLEDRQGSPENFFFAENHAEQYPRLPSLGGSATLERSPPQPWRKGLWCLNQTQPTRLSVEKTRKAGTGIISTAHLVNNDNFAIRSSRSPVVSPTVTSTKRFDTSPNAGKYRHRAPLPTPISREATLSPSPMYSQLPIQAKMEPVETWQQDFQNFHLRIPHQPSSTSPTTPSKPRHGQGVRHLNSAMVAQNAGVGISIPTYHGLPIGANGADGHNAADPGIYLGNGRSSTATNQNLNRQTVAPIWTTESLHSSDSSHQSYETMPQSMHSGQSGQVAHGIFQHQMNPYWSPTMAPGDSTWNSQNIDGYTPIAAPAPQRAATTAVIQSLDQPDGLGIQYPELEQMDEAVIQDPRHSYPRIPSGVHMPYSPSANHSMVGIPPVPPLPFPGAHGFSNSSPFTTPRKQRRSPSRSPSPSLSPTNTTSRDHRHRSPTRTDQPYSYHRRKSIHKSGPIRDNETNPMNSVRARSRSCSKPPRTPRTPKTPIGGFGVIDFVNFTPRDSQKLLNDVAPSGSSKTRARRDAEAREKRKKLSEAALKAVSSAGGDVEALKKAILT